MREREYPRKAEVTLSAAQRDAKGAIEKALMRSSRQDGTTVFLLTGLPGIGKSTVVEAMTSKITKTGGEVGDYDRGTIQKINNTEDGLIVVNAMPSEASLVKGAYENFEIEPKELRKHTLPGMTRGEMRFFLAGERRDSAVPLEELVENSMGIPRLGKRMARYPSGADPNDLAVAYLGDLDLLGVDTSSYETICKALEPYVTIPPSHEIYDRTQEYRIQARKNSYPVKLSDADRQSLGQLSPDFVDIATLDIYRQVKNLTLEQLHSADNNLIISVPHLSEREYRAITSVLGLSNSNHYFTKGHIPDAIASSSRGEIFRINGGKISIAIKDTSQNETTYDEDHLVPYTAAGERVDVKISIGEAQQSLEAHDASITLGCRDHRGLENNTLKFGHMVESLLQNLGVSYITYNGLVSQIYNYDSSEKRIHILKNV